jgi:hypothetical protein
MDSIVILDLKCIVFITFLTKLKGYMWGKKQEEIRPWMSIVIEKKNFNNNEWKVLHIHAIVNNSH